MSTWRTATHLRGCAKLSNAGLLTRTASSSAPPSAPPRKKSSIDKPAAPDESRGGVIDLLAASMTTASQIFSRNVRQGRLSEALASLPEDQREALRLRYVEGLPSKQIAERLGKTDGAVRVMLTRSLNKLQDMLGTKRTS